MSHSEQLITKLSHQKPEDTCCRLALLSAVVKIDGSIHLGGVLPDQAGALHVGSVPRTDRKQPVGSVPRTDQKQPTSLELRIGNLALARLIVNEFKSLFGLNVNINLRRINIANTVQSQITIEHGQISSYLEKLEVLTNKRLKLGLPKKIIKRTCCKKAFVRGAFLSGGYVNLSPNNPHLEIVGENKLLLKEIQALLKNNLIASKIRLKKNYFGLYVKSSKEIGKFLKYIEANKESLEAENLNIVKKIKMAANRLANAETANKNKVIKNAFRQIKDINYIENTVGLSSLTPGLRQICLLRVKHPQDSLTQLGFRAEPPLSKSAVNHRFRRIREIVQKDKPLV